MVQDKRQYQRAYFRRKRLDPVWAEKERIRCRDKERLRRANPAYQQRSENRRREFNFIKEEIGCGRCQPPKQWSAAALVFHHIDPQTKRYDVSGTRAWRADIRAEVVKCIVLCGGCHMELHDLLLRNNRAYECEVIMLERTQRAMIDELIDQFVEEAS